MLIDGLEFTQTAIVTGIKAEAVTALPTTNLGNGRIVCLTQQDGAYDAGFYIYLNSTWSPVSFGTDLAIALTAANSHADSVATTAENNAKSYADSKDTVTLSSANSHADSVATTAENNAKSYADTQVTAAKAYDIASGVSSKPSASMTVMTFKAPRAFTIPINFAGSTSTCGVAATSSSAVFSIKKNGTEVATLTFAVSGSSGTYSNQAAITFNAGDIMTITAPSSQNATLADIYWTISATHA